MTLLYTDGSCLHNDQPDPSQREMTALVTDSTGLVLVETHQHSGSNNIAELLAIEKALMWAKDNKITEVEIRTDSRNNLAWVYGNVGLAMNDRNAVMDLRNAIDTLRTGIDLKLVWVPRAKNLAGIELEKRAFANTRQKALSLCNEAVLQ